MTPGRTGEHTDQILQVIPYEQVDKQFTTLWQKVDNLSELSQDLNTTVQVMSVELKSVKGMCHDCNLRLVVGQVQKDLEYHKQKHIKDKEKEEENKDKKVGRKYSTFDLLIGSGMLILMALQVIQMS